MPYNDDEGVGLPTPPRAPKTRTPAPYVSSNRSNGSDSAWPVESDYERPSDDYIARQTEGPIADERTVTKQVQRRFDREYARGSADIDAATQRRNRRMKRRVVLRQTGGSSR